MLLVAVSRAHDLLKWGTMTGPGTISPCTITMDHTRSFVSRDDLREVQIKMFSRQ